MTYYIGQALGILAIAMTILMFQLKNKTHMLFVNIISNAATGDRSPVVLLVIALLIAAAAICVLVFLKKKSDSPRRDNRDSDEDDNDTN